MSPRSASVNEELRRRSRERLLQAAVELVGERGYEATTLGDIADRAGSARGLVSYYFPGKRQLVQSAVHRLMHRTLEEALEREPRTDDGQERMARAIDAILGLAHDRPVLMRQHMAGLLQGEGFVQCPEQRRLSELLGETIAHYGSGNVRSDYPMLRALLMGAVYSALVPGSPCRSRCCAPSCSTGTDWTGSWGFHRSPAPGPGRPTRICPASSRRTTDPPPHRRPRARPTTARPSPPTRNRLVQRRA